MFAVLAVITKHFSCAKGPVPPEMPQGSMQRRHRPVLVAPQFCLLFYLKSLSQLVGFLCRSETEKG